MSWQTDLFKSRKSTSKRSAHTKIFESPQKTLAATCMAVTETGNSFPGFKNWRRYEADVCEIQNSTAVMCTGVWCRAVGVQTYGNKDESKKSWQKGCVKRCKAWKGTAHVSFCEVFQSVNDDYDMDRIAKLESSMLWARAKSCVFRLCLDCKAMVIQTLKGSWAVSI